MNIILSHDNIHVVRTIPHDSINVVITIPHDSINHVDIWISYDSIRYYYVLFSKSDNKKNVLNIVWIIPNHVLDIIYHFLTQL